MSQTLFLKSFTPLLETKEKPLHLAIGIFDGVHLGHRAIVNAAVHNALGKNAWSGVLTFHPHPQKILSPNQTIELIYPIERRIKIIESLSADWIFVSEFTSTLAALRAKEFFDLLRQCFPSLHTLYVGDNFRFGHQRKGDVSLLKRLSDQANIQLHVIKSVTYQNERISSSKIRLDLQKGHLEQANFRLGVPYSFEGRSIPGQKRGQSIGYPTLNFAFNHELKPSLGVYTVYLFCNEKLFRGIANYGYRPTFEDLSFPLLEVHLLDPWPGTTEQAWMKIEWLKFLRGEKKFQNLEMLKEQIARDTQEAWKFFGKKLT